MGKKIFVGSLSWDTTEPGLNEAFQRFGDIVEAKLIVERDTGRSRGFGFITFESEESAQQAIDEMDGTELDGRTIRVDMAQDKGGGRGGRGGRGGGRY
jgi:RNA recognition motif-containing protein